MDSGPERRVDPHLWHACAGGMVRTPPLDSLVYYFPQGHSEHARGKPDLGSAPPIGIPAMILCRVAAVKYLADPETDEVYARLGLVPSSGSPCGGGGGGDGGAEAEGGGKPVSFAKTLTQSDANNGGGFSVPRYCAETIFPRLDYRAEPPVQTVFARDVHGETWKFRHIYRGTPRRHLLTTGWSSFVTRKKLLAGDSVVFLRAGDGELRVGIRRAKCSGWNRCAAAFLDRVRSSGEGESVVEAARLAACGRRFEVVCYPRGGSPEFCVKASTVRAAMQVRWFGGMRFKMAFETEDSSRVSWFMGTVSCVQAADPVRWPHSPWRLLQVSWDEPDLLQNVKRVNPWLVELVSQIPAIHLPPFSPPRKKLRFPPYPDASLLGELAMQPFSFCAVPNTPPGIQRARQARSQHESDENVSCSLTMGNLASGSLKRGDGKTPQFFLFGQPILTEDQIFQSSSNETGGNSPSDGSSGKAGTHSEGSASACSWIGNRIPMSDIGSGGLGDSLLRSYEEQCRELARMWNEKIMGGQQYPHTTPD